MCRLMATVHAVIFPIKPAGVQLLQLCFHNPMMCQLTAMGYNEHVQTT